VKRSLTVLPTEAALSLERFLAARLQLPPGEAQKVVREGAVAIDGRRAIDPARPLRQGERVVAHLSSAPGADVAPPLPIIYQDEDLAVVDKPAGLPVAATRQSAAHALDALLRAAGAPYVGVLHRLDLDASGLVVVSLRRDANPELHRQLAEHRAARGYAAVVAGRLQGSGRWSSAVAGRRAATRWTTCGPAGPGTRLELLLETGRTHQIRVHAAAAGHPVVGDRRHGGPPAPRLLLHAATLAFDHPRTGARLEFAASPPPDFLAALAAFAAR
jgi:23S rRNA pseudouridine1911/1915/1917 synthase